MDRVVNALITALESLGEFTETTIEWLIWRSRLGADRAGQGLDRLRARIAHYWRYLVLIAAGAILLPVGLFGTALIFHSVSLLAAAGIAAAVFWGIVLYAADALKELVQAVYSRLKNAPRDSQKGERSISWVSKILLWELIVIGFAMIAHPWNRYDLILPAALFAILLAYMVHVWNIRLGMFRGFAFGTAAVAFCYIVFAFLFPDDTRSLEHLGIRGVLMSGWDKAQTWLANPLVAIGGMFLIAIIGYMVFKAIPSDKPKYKIGFATGWLLVMLFMLSQVGQTLPSAQGSLPSLPSFRWGENSGVEWFEGLTPDEKLAERYERVLDPGVWLGNKRKGWNPQYVQVFRGDIVVFLCDGTYQWDPNVKYYGDAKPNKDLSIAHCGGISARPVDLLIGRGRANEFPMPEKALGSVIGRLGEGFDPFLIGRGAAYEVKAKCGIIDLAINDRQNAAAYSDNKGSAAVKILVFHPQGYEGIARPEC